MTGWRRAGWVVAMLVLGLVLVALAVWTARPERDTLVVGSKKFTESVILGELLTGLGRDAGLAVTHRRALGGSRILFNALVSGEIDAYVEYRGTLAQEIFAADPPRDMAALRTRLAEQGIHLAGTLGFENNYALGMPEPRAAALGISQLSQLVAHPQLRLRFGSEFMDRADGWPALRDFYGLPQRDVRGVEHELAYRALASGDADVTELYTTDAEIAHYGLRTLADDRGYFPRYEALLLYRAELAERLPTAVAALGRSLGLIDTRRMIAMNAAVQLEGRTETAVADALLKERFAIAPRQVTEGRAARLLRHTLEHLLLVAVSLAAAVVVAVPLGVLAALQARIGAVILAVVGVLQTIPALALLVFMIPLLGIGTGPALVALFLYSLLPIVRNTHAGLSGIPAHLRESATALGLPRMARLRLVEIPLALPTILAGIKTAAVIDVGAATLGALVGAGGYGQPILAGIRLDDAGLILEGAVPSALMAIAVQWAFERAERTLVPRGLRGR